MNLDQKFQNKLLLDVISRYFDEMDSLVRFVQNRIGRSDSSIITSYWQGQEHMLEEQSALKKYIKYECER